jgi:pyroglutamyl-peptidase
VSFNPSELIVKELAAFKEPGVVTALIPTSYHRAEADIVDLIHIHQPSVLLMLGLKRSASRLCLEQLALNMDNSITPDNDGEIRVHERIIKEAPDHYSNSLQLDHMADIAGDQGEPVDFSIDAGGYVCNHLFFIAAHLAATEFDNCRCGFVHVPPMEESSERLPRVVEITRDWVRLLKKPGDV